MMSTNRGATWTKEETEELIAIWGDETVQAQLESARHNHKIFEQISSSLAEKGFESRDGKQCQEKIKKLKKKYREVLDNNKKSGQGRKHWEFFSKMNEILGNRPMSRPSVLLESAPSDSPTPGPSSQDDGQAGALSDDDRDSQEERLDDSISTMEDDEGEISTATSSTSLTTKRKSENGSSGSRAKKSKAERSIEAATASFLATMKEADSQFLKAEEERQQREENRMKDFLKQQREMEERRLEMEERFQQQSREHELHMMQMIFRMFNQQPMHHAPANQQMGPAFSHATTSHLTPLQPPVAQPSIPGRNVGNAPANQQMGPVYSHAMASHMPPMQPPVEQPPNQGRCDATAFSEYGQFNK